MRTLHTRWLFALGMAVALSGCSYPSAEKKTPPTTLGAIVEDPKEGEEESEIQANLAKLSPEDRKLADAQRFCAVQDERLGSMGVPVKVMVNDQPVFLCCKSCTKAAQKDPEQTLARVKELKEKAAAPATK